SKSWYLFPRATISVSSRRAGLRPGPAFRLVAQASPHSRHKRIAALAVRHLTAVMSRLYLAVQVEALAAQRDRQGEACSGRAGWKTTGEKSWAVERSVGAGCLERAPAGCRLRQSLRPAAAARNRAREARPRRLRRRRLLQPHRLHLRAHRAARRRHRAPLRRAAAPRRQAAA